MRRFLISMLLSVVAGLFFAGAASAQEVYVQPPGNTPTAGTTDSGPGSTPQATPRSSSTGSDSEGTRVLGVQISRGEDSRLMFAATGGDVVGLVLLGAGLVGAGYVLRRRTRTAQLA